MTQRPAPDCEPSVSRRVHAQSIAGSCKLVRMSTEMGAGSVVLRSGVRFNGVKVFSATMFAQRDVLGEVVTAWMTGHPQCVVTELLVTQSSDSSFHCITITVFYREDVTR